ncbi:LamG-like jellyroll fold domain-containing protein [Emticicia sp. 17c]|uniref:LamG-like jellyroll fold domain-containing protein n=1 Tax=Emticicia sp. 17c TaxID=3127704 RepID=UPI00301B7CA3
MKKIYSLTLFFILFLPASSIQSSVIEFFQAKRESAYEKGLNRVSDPIPVSDTTLTNNTPLVSYTNSTPQRGINETIGKDLEQNSEELEERANLGTIEPLPFRKPLPYIKTVYDELDFYKYDSVTHTFIPNPAKSIELARKAQAFGFDPVRFRIQADKDSIVLGEDIEITITAEYLDVSPQLIFTFEGSNEYTLKMLMPKGFIVTGGTYYDFIQGKVSKDKPKQEFTIKGKFEYYTKDTLFTLLRSHKDAGLNDYFIKKAYFSFNNIKANVKNDLRNRNSKIANLGHFTFSNVRYRECVGSEDTFVFTATIKSNLSFNLTNVTFGLSKPPICDFISGGTTIIESLNAGESKDISITIAGDKFEYISDTIYFDFQYINTQTGILTCDDSYGNFPIDVLKTNGPTINTTNNTFTLSADFASNTISNFSWTGPNNFSGIQKTVTLPYTSPATGTYYVSYNQGTCEANSKIVVPALPCATPPTPSISQSSPVIIANNNTTLSVTAGSTCPNGGAFKWYNSDNVYQDKSGTSSNFSEGTYKVRCEVDGCTPSNFSSEVKIIKNDAPTLTTTANVICASETVILAAEGCHADATVRFEKFNGSVWEEYFSATQTSQRSTTTTTTGSYQALCKLNNIYSNPSNTVIINPPSQVNPPTVSINGVTGTSINICGKNATAILKASDCSGTVIWSNNATGEAITVSAKSGTYSAICEQTCGATKIRSLSSTTLTVNHQLVCDCLSILITTNAINDEIPERSTLELSVPEIEGATYLWSGPNIPATAVINQAKLIIPNVSFTNSGRYCVKLSCNPNPVCKTITVTDVDECANSFFHFAYSLSPSGQVGVGDRLGFVADGGDKYEWTGPNGFYSTQQFPFIAQASLANNGYYTVKISKLIEGTWCDKYVNVQVSIANCSFDAGPVFVEGTNDFELKLWANKSLEGATIEWFKGSTLVSNSGNFTKPKNDPNNRGTYTLKINLRGCIVEKTIDVDFIATSVFDGHLDNTNCDEITGWILDEPNKYKKLSYTIKVKIDTDEYSFPVNSDGGGGRIQFSFPTPKKFKNGISHTVVVYYPGGYTPIRNTTLRSFKCCTIEFAKVEVLPCTTPATTTSIKLEVTNNLQGGLQYYLEKQERDEDGNIVYKPTGIWQIPTVSPNSYTFTNVTSGPYRVTAREGSNGCEIKSGVSVFCVDTPWCNNTNVVIFPSGEIKEGIGIIPKLYANVQPEQNPDNPDRGGLYLDGTASISFTNYNYIYKNLTLEAWVNPSAGSSISVGDASDASRQQYLFRGWNGGIANRAAAQVSVGSNGINLIEEGDSYRRLALSYEGLIKGWNHIAVVYKNNLPTLLINGQVVASSTVAPPLNIEIVGPNSVGTDKGKGFVGSVYGFRVWAAALENTVVNQHKTNFDPTLAAYPNVGFWIFDKLPTGNYVEDLSSGKRQAKLEGHAMVLVPPVPVQSPNAPVITWWLAGIKVATGNTYTVPANKVKAGTLNYVVRYQKTDGTYCDTAVPVVIAPANYGSLSGCYIIKSTEGDPKPIAPYYNPTTSAYTIKKGYAAQGSEKEIWRFEHLGSEIYRINSAFFNDMALEGLTNEVTLKNKRISEVAQQWKANVVNASALTFSLVPQNNPTKRLHYDATDNSTVTLSTSNGTSENFILQPTACPLPAGECSTNNKITYERWLEPTLQSMPSTQWANLNVAQYIAENTNPYTVQVGLQKVSLKNSTANTFLGRPDAPTWQDSRYVNRLSGYICPPKNGDYTFYIKTDEWAELWISTDEDPAHKRLIARCVGYADNFINRPWEQRSLGVTLTKGRSYYFEVILKDEINSLDAEVAWQVPDEYVAENLLEPMPLTHISSIPRSITPSVLTVSASSLKVAATENVTLTASGCNYGRVIWKAGLEVVQNPNASMPTLTRQGPGIYQAMCVGDYTVNQDWVMVKVDLNGTITPIVTGGTATCPGTSVTLTASNAPPNSGGTVWSYQWFTITNAQAWRENHSSMPNIFDDMPTIFNKTTLPTLTVPGPGTYYVRIVSNNGYVSPIKEYTVLPAIPATVKATNDSPTPVANPLVLTATDIAAATYAWTGPNSYTANTRTATRTSFDANMAGIYTVTITTAASAGGCSVTATTEVIAANCDIYIKATNPTNNQEVYSLPRKVGGGFDPLTLKIENLDGTTANFSPYNIQWMLNGNPMEGAPNAATLSTDKIGEYVAILSLKMRPENTCEAKVNINAIPCKVYDGVPTCGTAPSNIEVPSTTAAGINLSIGDKFTVGDYTVVVTEITSGGAGGWNGKGYIEFRLIGDIAINKVAVLLQNAVINECYQLAGGKIETQYDPTWGNILDEDGAFNFLAELKNTYIEIIDLLTDYDCSANKKSDILSKINKIIYSKTGINSLQELNASEKTSLTSKIDEINTETTCYINDCNNGQNLRQNNSGATCSIETIKNKLDSFLDFVYINSASPEGKETKNNTSLCYDSSLPSFASITGVSDIGIANLNECQLLNKSLVFSNQISGESCANGLIYRGTWTVEPNDYEYWTLTTPSETYYITRHQNLSCLVYNVAKKSVWADSCKLGKEPCPNLWTRTNIPFGTTTGDKIADAIGYSFVSIINSGVLLELGALAAAEAGGTAFGATPVGEYLIANYELLALSFAETAAFCYDCTEEEFAAKFITVLGTNLISGYIISEALIPALKISAKAFFRWSLRQKTLLKGFAKLNEVFEKGRNIWDDAWGKIKTKFKYAKNAGDWLKIKSNILDRLAGKRDWVLSYTDEEIEKIVLRGKSQNIPIEEIEDIIFNGCRPDKTFDWSDLVSQIDFWKIVKQRGYPNLFQNLNEYNDFGTVLKNLATDWNLPPNSIYTQGSSLRVSNIDAIGDLDIAIIVDAATFESLVARFKVATTAKQAAIEADKIKGIIRGVNMHNSGTTRTFTGNFYDNFRTFFNLEYSTKFPNKGFQISIIKKGSSIDISPFLKF